MTRAESAPPGLISIGYQGREADGLVQTLVDHRVDVLVDVRLTARSRKPGMSKRGLTERLGAAGIRYLHLPALGNPPENREPFRRGDIAAATARFRAQLAGAESEAALTTLLDLARSQRVAVLCFEREHERCHRQVVIAEVVRREPLEVLCA
jgi:uncharacterized protein (DUF488 family)